MQHEDNSVNDCFAPEGHANQSYRHEPSLPVRKRKRTSPIWGNFTVLQKDGTKSCDLYHQQFAPLTSTTSMRYHLENKHKESVRQNDKIGRAHV